MPALATLAVLGVVGGVSYMVVTTLSGGEALEYFKEVDAALAEIETLRGQRVRLHGNVVSGSIQKKPGSLAYRFAIHHGNAWTDVSYEGIVPDSLKDCAEVVVKGRFGTDDGRRFDADKVVAKCPSKYEERQRTKGCAAHLGKAVTAARARLDRGG